MGAHRLGLGGGVEAEGEGEGVVPAGTCARVSPGSGGGCGGEGEEVLEEVVLRASGRQRLPRHGRRHGGGDGPHASQPEASGGSRQAAVAAVHHRDLRAEDQDEW